MNLKENIKKGRNGQKAAENYLKKIGWKIIEKNWHYSKNAEIDIIALDGNTLVFVEVKTRTTLNFGHPFEAINTTKLHKIYTAVYGYINNSKTKYKDFRIDGIAILGSENYKIEHIKNIGQF